MKNIILLLIIVFFSSCFRSDDCDPNRYCDTNYPDSAWVNINITYAAGSAGIPIILYDGYVEDGKEVLRDTMYSDSYSYYLPTRTFYSVKAVYQKSGQVVNAYDGGKLRIKKFWNCNQRCYEAPDLNLNVGLLD